MTNELIPTTILVPAAWLMAVVHLLETMADDGIMMEDCDDPEILMNEIAGHLGTSDDEDPWKAAVQKLVEVAGMTNETPNPTTTSMATPSGRAPSK
jgi:hypothetical protein